MADLTETSPRVCKPYLIVRSHVEPYVTPYYDTYAAPYVDQARPYVEVFNQRVYTPASKVAKSGYEKYGAPALEQAQAYGAEQWQLQVTPRLNTAQDKLRQLYLAEIDPYIQRSVAVVSPYYRKVNNVVFTVYQDHLVPFYTHTKPFVGKAMSTGQGILQTHIMPGAQYTWSSAVYFANSSLWPHVTGLYSEQVEPQLVKIGQRLASYREGKRLRAVVEDLDRYLEPLDSQDYSFANYCYSTTSVQPVTSSITKSQEQIHATSTVTTTSTAQAYIKPTLSPTEQAQQAREKIDSDLERWQGKFALAADKGIEDLEERIGEIVSALVASSANSHGQSLATALQSVSAEQISSIKRRINELAESMPEEDALEVEQSTADSLVKEIRTSAISVRDRAHALREWSIAFEDELVRRVTAAVDSTLNVLDSIRDLGLQEIGMRWAWMDGVTYKDWAKYHALKAQLEEWRNEIRNVGMNHKSLSDARAVASNILEHGMHEAEQAAKELVRLKDVGIWKIAAREVSDNFDSRIEPPPARPKPQVVIEESDEETTTLRSDDDDDDDDDESTETVPESDLVDEAFEDPLNADSDFYDESDSSMADDIVVDEQPLTKSAFGVAAADANSHPSPIIDDEEQDVVHNLASKAEDTYADVSSAVSEAIYGASVTPRVGEKFASLASDQYSHAWSAASTVLYGTPLSPEQKVSSAVSEKYSDAVAA